jgi:integrase
MLEGDLAELIDRRW